MLLVRLNCEPRLLFGNSLGPQEQAKHYGSLAKGIDPLGMLLAERPRLIHVGKAKRHNCG